MSSHDEPPKGGEAGGGGSRPGEPGAAGQANPGGQHGGGEPGQHVPKGGDGQDATPDASRGSAGINPVQHSE